MGKKYERFGKSILIRIDQRITDSIDIEGETIGIEGETIVLDEIEKRANYPSSDDMPPRRYDMLVDLADLKALREILDEVIEEIEYETKTFHKFPLIENDD